jgi:hypothetical protein
MVDEEPQTFHVIGKQADRLLSHFLGDAPTKTFRSQVEPVPQAGMLQKIEICGWISKDNQAQDVLWDRLLESASLHGSEKPDDTQAQLAKQQSYGDQKAH